jgi:DNA processing protein
MIAALSQLVVVVESHAKGGALSTVDEAMERGIPVGAVPGSTLSPASDGTNALLFDGAMPVRNATDVLVAMGLSHHSAHSNASAGGQLTLALGDLSELDRRVLDEVRGGTVHVDRIIELLGSPPPVVGEIVDRLVGRGLLEIRGHVVSADPRWATGPS